MRSRRQLHRAAIFQQVTHFGIEQLEDRKYLSLTFGPPRTTLPVQSNGQVFTADFNGDGHPDLLVNTTAVTGPVAQPAGTQIFFGNGDGTFGLPLQGPSIPAGFNFESMSVVGDVNGDGKPDIIQIATEQITSGGSTTYTTEITPYFNLGNGEFTAGFRTIVPFTGAPMKGQFVQVADFNSDGKSDLFLAFAPDQAGISTFITMKSNGDGSFSESNIFTANIGQVSSVSTFTGNFFGHGRTDVAAFGTLTGTQQLALFENNGNGTLTQFDRTLNLNTTKAPSIAAGDFNGDGLTDFAFTVIHASFTNLQVWTNDGNALFTPSPEFDFERANFAITGLSAGDFNHDGKTDLLATTQTGLNAAPGAAVFLSSGGGTFQPPVIALSGLTSVPVGEFLALDITGGRVADIVGTLSQNNTTFIETLVNNTPQVSFIKTLVEDPPEVLTGSVDSGNMNQITGWADDPSNPAAPIQVEVSITNGPTQIFTANEPRADLQSVLGSADHAFTYATPMLSAGIHVATVFAILQNGTKVPVGTATLVSQNSLFDEHFYLETNPDVAAAVAAGKIATGYDHYIKYGQFEGRNPNPYWNEAFYLQQNPDVAAAVKAGKVSSGFMQFSMFGQRENRPGLVYYNNNFYLANNPDVVTAIQSGAVTSGYEHFVLFGQYEGRAPMAYFSPAIYDADNPDVAPFDTGERFSSDIEQYVEVGQFEGRTASNLFNEQAYLTLNPDVAAAVNAGIFKDGLQHWLEFGQFEGRRAV
jgi:hypothetical protein